MHRLQGKSKDTQNWWNTFQTAKYPAYVTLVKPYSIVDLRKPRSHVKHVLLDDVLDQRDYTSGWSPATIEIKEGSFVLVLPDNASTARAHCVSPPWLCRVNSIWFVPGDKTSSHLDPKGTLPEVREWERTQIEQGRIAVHHFELQVTYFYRWPDFHDAIKNHPLSTGRLSQALQNLGVAENEHQVQALLNKRGCGNTPATHFGMRYVMYSNHETTAPTHETDEDGSDVDEENSPVPMESVMATAKVLFLDSKAKLPYLPTKAPAATAAAAAAAFRGKAALPAEQREALAAKRRQLVPGFVCNMFLVTAAEAGAAPRLFGLSEWANGTAGANLKGSWVARSRKQVQQLLQDTKAELKEAKAAARTAQQQLGGTSAAAALDGDDLCGDTDTASEQQQQQQQQQQQEDDAADHDVDLISTEDLTAAEAKTAAAAAAAGRKAGHPGSSKGGNAAAAAAAAAVGGSSGRGRGVAGARRRVVMACSSEENATEEEDNELHDEEQEAGQERHGEQVEGTEEAQSERQEDEGAGSSDEGGGQVSSSDEGEPPVTAVAAVRSHNRAKHSAAAAAAAPWQPHGKKQQQMQRPHSKQQQQQQHDKIPSSNGRQKRSSAAAANPVEPPRKRQKRKKSSKAAAADSGDSGPVVIDSD